MTTAPSDYGRNGYRMVIARDGSFAVCHASRGPQYISDRLPPELMSDIVGMHRTNGTLIVDNRSTNDR